MIKHSKAAELAHPAPSVGEGEEYALACKAVHDARVAFDKPKQTTAQRLDAIGIDAICERISDCETLQSIADSVAMSKWSLLAWLGNEVNQYAYARAREAQAEKMADDIMQIVDEPPMLSATGGVDSGDVAHKRLRMDARKWLAGKMNAKKYGDKVTNEHTGENGQPIQHSLTVKFVSPNKS